MRTMDLPLSAVINYYVQPFQPYKIELVYIDNKPFIRLVMGDLVELSDDEKEYDSCAVVGRLLQHPKKKYGFKLSFDGKDIAEGIRKNIAIYLRKQGFKVETTEGGYYDIKEEAKQ